MIGRFLKRFMPRSLFGRATLILLVPVGTILLVVSIVFIQRLYENVTEQMTMGVANEIGLIVERLESSADREQALSRAQEIAEPLGLNVSYLITTIEDRRGAIDLSGRTVISTLKGAISSVTAIDLVSNDGRAILAVDTVHGPVQLDVPRSRVSARNPHQFLVLIGITSVLMVLIALLYLRGQVRPIRRLAAAASAFGKGRVVPYRPTGAAEVRQAGNAFVEMRDRIERQIEQRTLMLSGVSHDLRTPLTRLRLALSVSEAEEAEAMTKDVDEMQQMLDAFLDFARSESLGEPERSDPVPFVLEVIENAKRSDGDVEVGDLPSPGPITLRPPAFRRALGNLIGNALRYGTKAKVHIALTESHVYFVVEDNGPGIPEHQREDAQKPFTRLDSARNQDAGSGVGLGLSIASDIARQHGGYLELLDSHDLGGLRVSLVLPR